MVLLNIVLVGCNSHQTKSEIEVITSKAVESSTKSSENKIYSDDYTLLIYMCGSSLESKNGSASDDISELIA